MEQKIIDLASAFGQSVPHLWAQYVAYVWWDSLLGIFGWLVVGVIALGTAFFGAWLLKEDTLDGGDAVLGAIIGAVAGFIVAAIVVNCIESSIVGTINPEGEAISRIVSK